MSDLDRIECKVENAGGQDREIKYTSDNQEFVVQ